MRIVCSWTVNSEDSIEEAKVIAKIKTTGTDRDGYPNQETFGLAECKDAGLCLFFGSTDPYRDYVLGLFPSTQDPDQLVILLRQLATEIETR